MGVAVTEAYIALGTNMGDLKNNLKNAAKSISLFPKTSITAYSKVYETIPFGYEYQNNFYNAVIKVKTRLSPHMLLGACLGIEAAFGRVRAIENGPRIIDLDLLIYGDVTEKSEELMLPHPEIFNRAFVFIPLSDVSSGIVPEEKLKNTKKSGIIRVYDFFNEEKDLL